MNTVVCMKWTLVPESGHVRVDPETNAMIREGMRLEINPFDENAVEAALQLREQHGGSVTVISMGPPSAEEGLRHCLAMGADRAVLISAPGLRGSDTLATSAALRAAIRKLGAECLAAGEKGRNEADSSPLTSHLSPLGVDLVICGKQAVDGDTGQVGPGLAERLGIPQFTFVIGMEVADGKLRVRRVLDDALEVAEAKLPALVTVVKQINQPRLPGMKGVLRARKAQIETWGAADLELDEQEIGFAGSPTMVIRTFVPPRHARGQMLDGSPAEAAQALAKLIGRLRIRVT